MKNLGAKLKLLTCLSLVLICALFALQFVPTKPIKLSAGTPVVGQAISDEITAFDDFAAAVSNLTSHYLADDNALVFLNKADDLTVDDNGNYLVSEQTFVASTGVVPALLPTPASLETNTASTSEYNLSELAKQVGYTVTDGERNVILTRHFGAKRLIIYSNSTNLDLYGAIAAVSYNGLHIHQYESEEATSEAFDNYSMRNDVDNVFPDSFCWTEDEVVATSEVETDGSDGFLGDDDLSYLTWGAQVMGVGKYSQYLLDVVNAKNNNITELPEVVVAVLDTGIDTDHPFLTNRLLKDENGKYVGYGLGYGKNTTAEYEFEDDQGHGTHCSGIIRDMTLSNVKILPLKFMKKNEQGNGTGMTSDAIIGMGYCITRSSDYNIVAINMSFGSEYKGTEDDIFEASEFQIAISSAYEKGIFCVAAAGNESDNAANHAPANQSEAITVSALEGPSFFNVSTSNLTFASYSNYGDCVDVCAPGSLISSAYIGGIFAYLSGTSMATPHVAAYIALLKSNPIHLYSKQEIKEIFANGYEGYIRDLGEEGKDIYYGYGMPVLTAATPDYLTIDVTVKGNGTVTPSGLNIYSAGDNVIIDIIPNEYHHVSAVYINNVLMNDIINIGSGEYIDQISFYDLDKSQKVVVEFKANEVKYTVNYYWEVIYDLDTDEPHDFELIDSEVLVGEVNDLTQALARVYQGFTAKEIEQQTINPDGSTVVNVYYTRNLYKITINKLGKGFTDVTGAGEYLYGDTVNLIPKLRDGYEWFTWQIDECDDSNFSATIRLRTTQQSFKMPASDLVLTAYSQPKVYLITVKVVGGGTATPETSTVHYGEGKTLEFRPKKGYKIDTVSRDGVSLELTEVSSGVYVVNLSAVTANTDLSVVFVKDTTTSDLTNLAVWGGGGIIAVILFGSSAAMLIIAFHGRKTSASQVITRNVKKSTKEEPILSPENHLLAALEFINGREVDFKNFCNKNHLDYQNKYRQAVLKFYNSPENRILAALEFISGREGEFMTFCRENQINYQDQNQYRDAVVKFYDFKQKK